MRKLTLRSLWEHKRRLVSTVVAIVLGVAFMSGTFVFADTIDRVFDDLFSDGFEGIDVVVQGSEIFDEFGFGGGDAPRRELTGDVVTTVSETEGIVAAEGFVSIIGFGSSNRVLDADGDPVGSTTGPPTLLESWVNDERLRPYRLTPGSRGPQADDEMVINVAAADDAGFEIGDEVTVITQFGESTYRLVGTVTYREAKSAAGAVTAEFTLAETQRFAGLDGTVNEIYAIGGGESPEVLKARVAERLPEGAEVITGAEAAEQNASDIQEGFAFFRQILTIFGAIALIVGTFIISNTFSILVAQRTRELALLRAIGASRRQVLTSVLLEASVVGLVAAVAGLVGGILLAIGVTNVLRATGADFPAENLVVSSTTVIIAFGVGLGVTMFSAIIPAVQATRVPPLAALRDVAIDRSNASRARMVIGALVLAFSLANLGAAVSANDDIDMLPQVGLGSFALIVGAIIVGPVLAKPTVRVLGAALPRLRGVTGVLATENAARNPKRTAATASALVIGVALIGFITIFGASAQASITQEIEGGFDGDLIVQAEFGFGPPAGFPAAIGDAVAAHPDVEIASRSAFLLAQVTFADGTTDGEFMRAVEPESLDLVMDVEMIEGELADLTPGNVLVAKHVADDADLGVGDEVTVTGTNGTSLPLVVSGVAGDAPMLGDLNLHIADYGQLVNEQLLSQVVVALRSGADFEATRAELEEIVDSVPGLSVQDKDEFIGSLTDQITSFLTVVRALLLLSVVIAMIGVANTLSLSIHERTRELGLLRAVGMTRSQLRSAVRWEAVIISLLGTGVGLGIGLLTSWSLVQALSSFGLSTFDLPVGELAFVVGAAATLGIVAAIRPARRASRLDILEAIATE